MSTTNYEKHNCPIAQSLSVLGDQWTLLIARDALSGLRRFSEFQKKLGISRNLLAQRLKQLCQNDILERVPIAGSTRSQYLPTQKCRDLRMVILALADWGQKWSDDPELAHVEVTQTSTGLPVKLRFYQEQDDIRVSPEDITMVRT